MSVLDDDALTLTSDGSSRRVELAVSGMTCGSCAARVERKLNKVDGVRASVNYATRIATVDATDVITTDALLATVSDAGYSAKPRESLIETARADPDADQARSLFRRLVVCLILFFPLADLSVMFSSVAATRFAGWEWLLLALSIPVVTWGAWPFYRTAVQKLRVGAASMETLVSLGIVSATAWSLYTLTAGGRADAAPRGVWQSIVSADAIYLEVAAGVTVFVLAGRYFEAKARSRAGGALRALAALGARDVAVLLRDGSQMRIPVDELKEGQQFVVRPGETIAADGLVMQGSASVDASAMTGESRPVPVHAGSTVVGGTVALDGRLIVEAAAVGSDTQFAALVRLVEHAQSGKAQAQRVADRVSNVFVPCVIALAVATLVSWLVAGGAIDHAIASALAVLVIACPCALGLATPTALMVASGRGAQLGIFLKGHDALDASRDIDTVVFDKTGTITEGRPTVTSTVVTCGWDVQQVLNLAAEVESASEHSVGQAIVRAADNNSRAGELVEFVAEPGRGVCGTVDGIAVMVGSPQWCASGRSVPAAVARHRKAAQAQGKTVVYVVLDGQLCAAITVTDAVKESAVHAIAQLHDKGIATVLLTGDNEPAARAIADAVGISEVHAEVLPEGKVDVIDQLRMRGRAVAMVGDGINDGPALASSDLALAIGRGTDVAIGAADIILVRDSLDTVPEALALAGATRRTIQTNLLWAFGYNIATIPLAAAGLLNPLLAGAAMAFSSFFVVSNSLRLRGFALEREARVTARN